MSLPLPPYDPDDPEGLQFILDKIADALIDTGAQTLKVRVGTATATWTAAVTSGAVTVAHGMGSTPVAVSLLPIPGGGAVLEAMWRVTTLDATNIVFDGTRTAAITNNTNVAWIAIG